MRPEELVRALEGLGLTGKEAAAYLCLVRNGASTAHRVSEELRVQYPAVYRILQSLQGKGWIEVSNERPNRYRARPPRIVAEEARQGRVDDLAAAAEVIGSLEEAAPARNRDTDGDLWIYKGPEAVARKLREIVLASRGGILCASPFPVARDVLRLLVEALGRSRRPVRLVLSEANRADAGTLGSLLGPTVRLQFRFPDRPLPATRLAHSFVFPNDAEVFIVNSFYREGTFVPDKLQGLWVGDMDFVRIQLEAMLQGLEELPKSRRRLPRGA
jgi:sugar-specific transcriptional regulator TrmB